MKRLSHEQIAWLRSNFPQGTRIMLDYMAEDPNPVPAHSCGTVQYIDDAGTIHCIWDNQRTLGICPEVDRFHKI